MKKRTLILLLCTLSLMGCRQLKRAEAESSAIAPPRHDEQNHDDLASGGVAPRKLMCPLKLDLMPKYNVLPQYVTCGDPQYLVQPFPDAANTCLDIAKIQIKPDTTIYFKYLTEATMKANKFRPYQDQKCAALSENNYGDWSDIVFPKYYPKFLWGDAIFIGYIIKENGVQSYCVNNRLTKYGSQETIDVAVLAPLHGDVKVGVKTYYIDSMSEKYKAHTMGIYNAIHLKDDDYLLRFSIHASLGATPEVIDFDKKIMTYDYINIPPWPIMIKCLVTVGFGPETNLIELRDFVNGKMDPDSLPISNRKEYFIDYYNNLVSRFKQKKGTPGDYCDIELDKKWEEEKRRLTTPQPKLVPCPTCPGGQMVEDWEIGDYYREKRRLERLYNRTHKYKNYRRKK